MSATRRRFLITAAACGLALPAAAAAPAPHEWTGLVLGAVATVRLAHPDPAAAKALLARVAAEARRLERIFSLYDPESELCRLNREGVLVGPSPELVELFERAERISELTGGVFDPTVQPLWLTYAAHFSAENPDPSGPSRDAIEAALTRVGRAHLKVDRDRIVLDRGAGVTLNGIAQGHLSDRIVALLAAAGVDRALVDMGEPRALGPGWRVGIADPENASRLAGTVVLEDRAAATSAANGFRFETSGRFNHLFDPVGGGCADPNRSLTVLAADATTADGLSTAFALMDDARVAAIVARLGDVAVLAADGRGGLRAIGRSPAATSASALTRG